MQLTYDDMMVLYRQMYHMQVEIIDLTKQVMLKDAEITRLKSLVDQVHGPGMAAALATLESSSC